MASLTLISCWMIMMMSVQFKVKGDLSPALLDYLSVYSGYFDNFKQAMESNGTYDLLQVKCIPVLLPFIQAEPVLLSMEAINHRLYRLFISRITASPDGKTFYITPYNFTDNPSQYKLEDVNATILVKFKPEDYKRYQNCRSVLHKTSSAAYSGRWTDCKHAFNGSHFDFPISFDCDTFMLNAHKQSTEARTVISYDLKFTGERYPVPGAPSDYISPCQHKKSDK